MVIFACYNLNPLVVRAGVSFVVVGCVEGVGSSPEGKSRRRGGEARDYRRVSFGVPDRADR